MANILHHIKAILFPNWLTEDPNDFAARVVTERSLNVSEICSSAVNRGGAATTPEAMEHNVNLFLKEMAYQLCDGYSVNTGYFTAGTLIKGVFHSPDETFDPARHSVIFQFNQGETLRKELANVTVDITGVGDSSIAVAQVTDVKTGSVNDLLTPNRNLKIKGYKLKLAGDNPAVGVHFVNQATSERIKVAEDEIVTNNPSELVIITPMLVAGTYALEVTSQFSGNVTPLKEPRTSTLDKVLTVK
ncbi:MAG TPA: DNA-binding domain-containing protein [Paludibacter sp.]|nr:DNA-binding domain-containing protein [Paludibacter sp.]